MKIINWLKVQLLPEDQLALKIRERIAKHRKIGKTLKETYGDDFDQIAKAILSSYDCLETTWLIAKEGFPDKEEFHKLRGALYRTLSTPIVNNTAKYGMPFVEWLVLQTAVPKDVLYPRETNEE